MSEPIDRRNFLKAGSAVAAGGVLLLLSGCTSAATAGATSTAAAGSGAGAVMPDQLVYSYWGSSLVDANIRALADAFDKKMPPTNLIPQNTPWANFWTKLSTEMAAGKGPDAFQMSNQLIMSYSNRDSLYDFERFVGSTIKLEDWDKNLRDYGVIEGKRVGIPISTDAFTALYNVDWIKKAGVTMPTKGWTWTELAEVAREAAKAGGRGTWGMSDGSGNYEVVEAWMRGLGKSWFTDVGTDHVSLGFSRDEFGDFLNWWAKGRRNGSVAPADVSVQDGLGDPTSSIVKGLTPIFFTSTSELEPIRALTKARIQPAPMPDQAHEGTKRANFVRPNLFISSPKTTEHPDAVAKLINFWINNPDAVRAMGFSQGVPPSPASAALLKTVQPDHLLTAPEYLALVREIGGPMDSLTPNGGRDVYSLLTSVASQVQFGQITVSQAVDNFFGQAPALLE